MSYRTGFEKKLNTPTLDQIENTDLQNLQSSCIWFSSCSVWMYGYPCVCADTEHYSFSIRQQLFIYTNYAWEPLDGIKISFLLTCIKFYFF